MAQFYAVTEATIYGYIPANHYFSSLHSIVVEAEDDMINATGALLLTAMPQFSGLGYISVSTDNRVLLLI